MKYVWEFLNRIKIKQLCLVKNSEKYKILYYGYDDIF